MIQIKKKGEKEVLMILPLYSKMKKDYVEAEVEIIEIATSDIITASDCTSGGAGGTEETEIL